MRRRRRSPMRRPKRCQGGGQRGGRGEGRGGGQGGRLLHRSLIEPRLRFIHWHGYYDMGIRPEPEVKSKFLTKNLSKQQ